MRGEEQKCLNVVKKIVFYNSKGNVLHDCNNKTFLDVDDNTFCENLNSYCWFNKNTFGLLKTDIIEVANLLRKAKFNEKPNDFPDFIFDDGFIEHFQVTSSRENRNGSLQMLEENKFLRSFDQKEAPIKQCGGGQRNCSYNYVESVMTDLEHEYKSLQESFNRNFQKHLKSLDNYKGNKQIGIFMIEYNDALSAEMVENIYKDFSPQMTKGDFDEAKIFQCYRLSRDKELLNYIYNYKDKLKYIIYVYCDFVRDEDTKGKDFCNCKAVSKIEIIKIESIPNILKLLPWDYRIDISSKTRELMTQCICVNKEQNE